MADKNTVFQQKLSLKIRGAVYDLSAPKVMGVLNLTPDSFYDGGKHFQADDALKRAAELVSEGADILDLGAYSSRPGADHISEAEEVGRLSPVLRLIRKEFPALVISVDTFRSQIARIAVTEGADIINDISAGEMDPQMFKTIAELKVPYILMHMKGTPLTMVKMTQYENVQTEVLKYLEEKCTQLIELGLTDLIVDPGFGFAKNLDQNYELLKNLELFKLTGHPVLAGLSRKSMIYRYLDTDVEDALIGTTVANTIALIKGANILRVHDVKAACQAIQIVSKIS